MREDWLECELGEVFDVVSGNTPAELKEANKEGDIPFFKVSDMNHTGNEVFMKHSNIFLSSADIEKLKIKLYPKETVIFPKRGGAILTNKKRILINGAGFDLNVMGVLPNNYVIGFYTFYWFIKLDLSRIYDGSNVPQINNKNILPLIFPLAPLPIQRAIVSKIEALFSDLDNGIANFKKAQEQLKIYRQAVLKKAFEGYSKLTTTGDEFDFVGGGTPSKANSDYWNGELYWCSVKDVKGDYLHKTIDKISRQGLKKSAANLAQPEEVILITRISPGKTIISKVETAINQDLKVVKPKREYLPRLIHYLFQAYQREIIKLSSGTTVLGINLTNLKSIKIPFLSSQEQTQIVQEIESRLSVCDKMEQSISESLEKAEALRQSILKKAFEGKLLSQAEIEQCKKATDYEPAAKLLERIKQEKTKKDNNKKTKLK